MTASGSATTIRSAEIGSASVVGVALDIVGVLLPGLVIGPGAAAV
jgi:hypothetical protein